MPIWLLGAWRFIRPLMPYIAAALVVLGLLSAYGHREYGRGKHSRDAEVARITQDRDTHAANERILQAALDRQNAAVVALKTEADQRVAAGQKAVAEVRKANQSLQTQAEMLRRSGNKAVPKDRPCVPSPALVMVGKI